MSISKYVYSNPLTQYQRMQEYKSHQQRLASIKSSKKTSVLCGGDGSKQLIQSHCIHQLGFQEAKKEKMKSLNQENENLVSRLIQISLKGNGKRDHMRSDEVNQSNGSIDEKNNKDRMWKSGSQRSRKIEDTRIREENIHMVKRLVDCLSKSVENSRANQRASINSYLSNRKNLSKMKGYFAEPISASDSRILSEESEFQKGSGIKLPQINKSKERERYSNENNSNDCSVISHDNQQEKYPKRITNKQKSQSVSNSQNLKLQQILEDGKISINSRISSGRNRFDSLHHLQQSRQQVYPQQQQEEEIDRINKFINEIKIQND